MDTQAHDAVVVGGGIIGLACAYYLAKGGADTILLERALPGAEQTVRTGGGIRLCHSSTVNAQLSMLSRPLWEGFEEELGIDPRFKRIGHLFLARSGSTEQTLGEQARAHAHRAVPSTILDLDEVRRRWPALRVDGYQSALLCTGGGYLDHHRAVQGLYQGAIDAGALVRVGVGVTGMLRSGGHVHGVETTEGTVLADHVVNAAGASAAGVALMAGVRLPIISRRHKLLIIQPEGPVPEDIPWLIDVDGQVHLRPDGQGRAMVGGFLGEDPVVDPHRYDPRYGETWASRVRIAAADAFGLSGPDATILRGWAGLYVGTPDYHPVIERSCPGLLTAAGFSGTGLMHAPGVGMLITELARGEATSVDISALGSSRFHGPIVAQDTSGF